VPKLQEEMKRVSKGDGVMGFFEKSPRSKNVESHRVSIPIGRL